MEDNQTASDRIRDRNVVDMLRNDRASGSKKNWKVFRDKLRLKRAGTVWTSTVPIPASDLPINTNTNRMMMRRGSSRYPSDPNVDDLDGEATRQLGQMPERQRSSRLLPIETDPEEEEGGKSVDDEQKPEGDQQISLMSLLSDLGSTYHAGPDEHIEEEHHEEPIEEEEEEKEEEEDIGDYNFCCECKSKHKGTEIGPCGHTFCKHCTKELHVSTDNCPTCSKFMLEILDIF